MVPDVLLSEEEVNRVQSYADEVVSVFRESFATQGGRLERSDQLIGRFIGSVGVVLGNGRSFFRGVDEAHNELCIAGALLANRHPKFSHIYYEPPLKGTGKTIDFRAVVSGCEHQVLVDVKTIKPIEKDRWDQFQTALKNGWLPINVSIALLPNWGGGQIWHDMFAARSRMLEHSLELERKIREGAILDEGTTTVLALCGEGFHWTQDQLEDFVAFYRTGFHRTDDPFCKVEMNDIRERNITLDRTISRFACMRRTQFEVYHRCLTWDVRPPAEPGFMLPG